MPHEDATAENTRDIIDRNTNIHSITTIGIKQLIETIKANKTLGYNLINEKII